MYTKKDNSIRRRMFSLRLTAHNSLQQLDRGKRSMLILRYLYLPCLMKLWERTVGDTYTLEVTQDNGRNEVRTPREHFRSSKNDRLWWKGSKFRICCMCLCCQRTRRVRLSRSVRLALGRRTENAAMTNFFNKLLTLLVSSGRTHCTLGIIIWLKFYTK